MGISSTRPLPTPAEVKAEFPMNGEHHIAQKRHTVKNIIAGTDKRLLMIVGPCSAWPLESMDEYAESLAALQNEVKDHVVCVLRTYIQKPRSRTGWEGPMIQPDPLNSPDLIAGIRECRHMMQRVGIRLPLADEMLHTHNAQYFLDALSYLAVGARSSTDQEHRNFASMFDCPVGMKNDTSGSIEDGVNGVEAAQRPHTFTAVSDAGTLEEVTTTGNPYAHLILRGGKNAVNYDALSLQKANGLLLQSDRRIVNPAIIVDASHDNSGKSARRQPDVVKNVVSGIVEGQDEYRLVRGMMLESHLEGGKQSIQAGMNPRKSITDDCLGLSETVPLIRMIADMLDRRK